MDLECTEPLEMDQIEDLFFDKLTTELQLPIKIYAYVPRTERNLIRRKPVGEIEWIRVDESDAEDGFDCDEDNSMAGDDGEQDLLMDRIALGVPLLSNAASNAFDGQPERLALDDLSRVIASIESVACLGCLMCFNSQAKDIGAKMSLLERMPEAAIAATDKLVSDLGTIDVEVAVTLSPKGTLILGGASNQRL
jgi:hypothetical protein